MDSSQKGGLDTPSGILKTSSMSLQRIEKDYRDRKDDTLRFELPAPGRRANKPVVPEVRLNFTAEKHNFAAESLVTIPEEDKYRSNSQNSVKSILKKSKYLSQKSIPENKSQKSHKKPKLSERTLQPPELVKSGWLSPKSSNSNQPRVIMGAPLAEPYQSGGRIDHQKSEKLQSIKIPPRSPQISDRKPDKFGKFEFERSPERDVEFSRHEKFKNSMVKLGKSGTKGPLVVDYYNYQFNDSDSGEIAHRLFENMQHESESDLGGFENYQRVDINVFPNETSEQHQQSLNGQKFSNKSPSEFSDNLKSPNRVNTLKEY
jgi:hypothetical protein